MATNKTRLQLKAAKQRRQKMIAIGGAVLLGLILVIQVPRTLKMLRGSSSAQQTPATATVPATQTDQPTQALPAATGGELPDRNAAPAPQDGQLTSFELFPSKDPFVQQVAEASGEATSVGNGLASQSTSTSQASTPQASTQQASSTQTTAERSPASAVIAVNGTQETVRVSQTFPANNPTFMLVSAGSSSAKISVAGGKLADGARTVTLNVARKLTLVNTVDGTRYELVLRSTK